MILKTRKFRLYMTSYVKPYHLFMCNSCKQAHFSNWRYYHRWISFLFVFFFFVSTSWQMLLNAYQCRSSRCYWYYKRQSHILWSYLLPRSSLLSLLGTTIVFGFYFFWARARETFIAVITGFHYRTLTLRLMFWRQNTYEHTRYGNRTHSFHNVILIKKKKWFDQCFFSHREIL